MSLKYGDDTIVNSEDMARWLSKLRSKHSAILIHSCFAASFPHFQPLGFPGRPGLSNDRGSQVRSVLSQTKGVSFIFAGPPDKVTWNNHFGEAVTEAFKRAKNDSARLFTSKLESDITTYMLDRYSDCKQYMYRHATGADFPLWNPDHKPGSEIESLPCRPEPFKFPVIGNAAADHHTYTNDDDLYSFNDQQTVPTMAIGQGCLSQEPEREALEWLLPSGGSTAAHNEIRLAVVVGNNEYKTERSLRNAVNDACKIADKLRSLGFSVLKLHDATKV